MQTTFPPEQVTSWVLEETDDGISFRFSRPVPLGDSNIGPIGAELFRIADQLAHRRLTIDLGNVTSLDSTVLGRLVGLYAKLREIGGRLALRNASAAVYEVFKITRLDSVLGATPA